MAESAHRNDLHSMWEISSLLCSYAVSHILLAGLPSGRFHEVGERLRLAVFTLTGGATGAVPPLMDGHSNYNR